MATLLAALLRIMWGLGVPGGALGVILGCLGKPSGVPGGAFGVLREAFGGLLGSFEAPWGPLGCRWVGRVDSWVLRGRFPGFSGKFREAFWLHFWCFFDVFLGLVF